VWALTSAGLLHILDDTNGIEAAGVPENEHVRRPWRWRGFAEQQSL